MFTAASLMQERERYGQKVSMAADCDLWRSGYVPTDAEFDALSAFCFDETKRRVQQELLAKAQALHRFRRLKRVEKMPREARLQQVATESGLHISVVRYIVNGGDPRVTKLADEIPDSEFGNPER